MYVFPDGYNVNTCLLLLKGQKNLEQGNSETDDQPIHHKCKPFNQSRGKYKISKIDRVPEPSGELFNAWT